MKIGTFVGQQGISLNNDEFEFFKSSVKSAFDEFLSQFQCDEPIIIEDGEYGAKYKIPFSESNVVLRNNSDGACFVPKYIIVSMSKSIGYDENKCGKCYEWKDGYKPTLDMSSYSLTIDMMGDYRGYRKRCVWRGVGITQTTYLYGTELSDVLPTDGICKIARYLKGSYPTKVKF
jgi:hypothetical protein